MSNVPVVAEPEEAIKGEAALVRHVSNLVKDGNSSRPPTLFRHSSMQKIRHCCQNLNLFPYLLYSFDNSKSHPIARTVHLCFGELLKGITARIFFLYKTLRWSVLHGIRAEDASALSLAKETSADPTKPRFLVVRRQKRKENPVLLTLAVYFAPLFLAFQLIGLFSLMVVGKYTPGFIFLTTALFFLGYISLKILFHQTTVHRVDCEKSKIQ